MELKLVMARFGSGGPWPIGVFDNDEDMQRVIEETGVATTIITLDMTLNGNYEARAAMEAEQRYQHEVKAKRDREVVFDRLNEEGHIVRNTQTYNGDRHITYDGINTLCGYRMGKKWARTPFDQRFGETCARCFQENH